MEKSWFKVNMNEFHFFTHQFVFKKSDLFVGLGVKNSCYFYIYIVVVSFRVIKLGQVIWASISCCRRIHWGLGRGWSSCVP